MKSLLLIATIAFIQLEAHAAQVLVRDISVRTAKGIIHGSIIGERARDKDGTLHFADLELRTAHRQSYFLVNPESNFDQISTVDRFICASLAPKASFTRSSPLSDRAIKGRGVVLLKDGTALELEGTELEAYSVRSSATCSEKRLDHIGE